MAPWTTTKITASPTCGLLPNHLCPRGEYDYPLYDTQMEFPYPRCCQDYMICDFVTTLFSEDIYPSWIGVYEPQTLASIGLLLLHLIFNLKHLIKFYLQKCPHGEVYNPITLQCDAPSGCDFYDCLDEQTFYNLDTISCTREENWWYVQKSLPKCCPYFIACSDDWNGQPVPLSALIQVIIPNLNFCCMLSSRYFIRNALMANYSKYDGMRC